MRWCGNKLDGPAWSDGPAETERVAAAAGPSEEEAKLVGAAWADDAASCTGL